MTELSSRLMAARRQNDLKREIGLLKPRHCWNLEPHSREWFDACNDAFLEAMQANPSERPPGTAGYNAAGSSR